MMLKGHEGDCFWVEGILETDFSTCNHMTRMVGTRDIQTITGFKQQWRPGISNMQKV
jgi:hypothetical protein